MWRMFLLASLLLATLATFGCNGGSNARSSMTARPIASTAATTAPRVSPVAKPSDVPVAATPVVQTSTLGEIARRAEQTPQVSGVRTLVDATCANSLLTIHTSKETIYASLSCDKFSDQQFAQHFAGKQAALVLEAGPQHFHILIETVDGAQAEFTP